MIISNTDYILKWIEKSKSETDAFDKFVYGFFALNAMYSVYYDGDERYAIKKLFASSIDAHYEEYREILYTSEYEYFCNRPAIKNCKYDPFKEHPGPRDTSRDKMDLVDRSPKKSNRAMLMILYQVRCNLFHGNKSFSNADDQEIMKNAAELLLRYNLILSKELRDLNPNFSLDTHT